MQLTISIFLKGSGAVGMANESMRSDYLMTTPHPTTMSRLLPILFASTGLSKFEGLQVAFNNLKGNIGKQAYPIIDSLQEAIDR